MDENRHTDYTIRDRETLIRLDERTRQMADALPKLEARFEQHSKDLEERFVSRSEFEPVRNLVYRVVWVIVAAVVVAVLVKSGLNMP